MVRNSGTYDIPRRTSVANRLRIMSAKNPGLDDMIDRIIDNPAYDQMGGYQIFLRRFAIPVIMILIALFVYTTLDQYISSSWNLVITSIVTGSSLGPILAAERYLAIRNNKKYEKTPRIINPSFVFHLSWTLITVKP